MPQRRVAGARSTSCTGSRGRPADRRSSPSPSRAPPPACAGASRGVDRVAQAVVAVDDRRRRRTRACARPATADALDRGDLARLVELPQAREAPQLALQVAASACRTPRGPPPASPPRGSPRARRSARSRSPRRSAGVSSASGDARDDHLALDPLHHDRTGSRSSPGPRTPRAPSARAPACPSAPQQARLAQHVVRARRQRRARRAAQDHLVRPRARSGRSRSSDPRRSAAHRSRPRRVRARRGTRAAARAPAAAGARWRRRPRVCATMSSGRDGHAHAPQRYPTPGTGDGRALARHRRHEPARSANPKT